MVSLCIRSLKIVGTRVFFLSWLKMTASVPPPRMLGRWIWEGEGIPGYRGGISPNHGWKGGLGILISPPEQNPQTFSAVSDSVDSPPGPRWPSRRCKIPPTSGNSNCPLGTTPSALKLPPHVKLCSGVRYIAIAIQCTGKDRVFFKEQTTTHISFYSHSQPQ